MRKFGVIKRNYNIMPYVEESDLVRMHEDIDKLKRNNLNLLDQLRTRNEKIRKRKKERNILAVGASIVLLLAALVMFYSLGVNDTLVRLDKQLEIEKQRVAQMQEGHVTETEETALSGKDLAAIDEPETLENYKNYTNDFITYSVQVAAFADSSFNLTSESLINSHLISENSFYRYSLGVFDNVDEARTLRSKLHELGFNEAFIASYQNGKRLKIENVL